MTFSAVGSTIVPSLSFAGSSATFTLVPNTIGDFILFEAQDFGTGAATATAMSSSNVTWTPLGTSFSATNALLGAPSTAQVFIGKVTAASSATVTITYNTTIVEPFCTGQEFSSTVGAASVALDAQGNFNANAGSTTWTSLTPTHGAGELYYGYALNNSSASSGTTSGYVYNASADGHGDGSAYNVSCPNSATAPVWGDNQQCFGIMILVYEASGTPAPNGMVQPRATVPVPRRTPARAAWRGGSGQAYVAVAAPRQQPGPAPRRKPARAVWHGNTGQAYVAVAAPKQQPRAWPRRTPARAYVRGTPLVASNAAPVTATTNAGPAVGVLPYAGGIILQSLSQTFTASGSWMAPAGIIGAPAVYAWGPSGTAASGTAGAGGGGGGGGSLGGEPALGGVTPGTTLTVTIGAAGTGNPTTVTGGSVTVQGNAGGNASAGTGGAAGAASSNTVTFAGGAGGNSAAGGSGGGGGGGGSAGAGGAGGTGGAGSGVTGGSAGSAGAGSPGGAAGGAGGTGSSGGAGTAPGGAGGGGSGGAVHTGGAASAGQAVIYWQVLTPVPMAMQRRALARARVQSKPVQTTNTVAVPAPVQQPHTWPRRVPSRAVVQFAPVRTTNNTAFVSVPAPVQQPRPAPRRTPTRAFIQFRPVRTTNAAPAVLLGTPPTIPTSGGDRSPTIRVFREIRPGDVPTSGAQMPRLTGRAFAVPIPVDTDHTTHSWDETPDEAPPVSAGPSLLDQARTELDELAKAARDAADAIDRAADRARPIVEGIGSKAYDLGKIFGSQPYDPRPRKVCGSTHMAGDVVLTCQRKPHDDGWHSDKGLHWR